MFPSPNAESEKVSGGPWGVRNLRFVLFIPLCGPTVAGPHFFTFAGRSMSAVAYKVIFWVLS